MSATIISITTHRRYEKGSKRGRQRVFTMGYHTYSGGPGCCWSCNYWIKTGQEKDETRLAVNLILLVIRLLPSACR
jgi:hypothetical protein